MKCLVVIAHPLADSLCRSLATQAIASLEAGGHEVVIEDLYANDFVATLTVAERASYYAGVYQGAAVQGEIARLLAADAIVLCFPTWWFGFPAILKGWFDRVWAPGIAYDHASDLGPIKPRLHNLKKMLAITTLGAAGWIDRLIMWCPVKRVLKIALLGACAPKCRFEMLSHYKSERLNAAQVTAFQARIAHALEKWHA